MQTRRSFIQNTLAALLVSPSAVRAAAEQPLRFNGKNVFTRILKKCSEQNWYKLSIGALTGKIALELQGTPYVGQTLELSTDHEICSTNMAALDCVTFVQTTLAFARMVKKGGRTPDDLLKEVQYIRYRDGIIGDYTSRLHYTTDWFFDNENRHILKPLANLPGEEKFTQQVGFMSSHADKYRQLAAHAELVPKIRQQEAAINSRHITFVPMNKLESAQSFLKTGDIVGVCTNEPGLDIVHTGMIFCSQDGTPHFMDASSRKSTMKVVIEHGPISKTLNWSKSLTGAMFARPLEPS